VTYVENIGVKPAIFTKIFKRFARRKTFPARNSGLLNISANFFPEPKTAALTLAPEKIILKPSA